MLATKAVTQVMVECKILLTLFALKIGSHNGAGHGQVILDQI
jgi:hypothetical protein